MIEALKEPSLTDWIVALFTVVLAVSTIGLWMSTRRLWKGAEAQAADFRRSVAAAEASAAAAAESAATAREDMRISNRPYVNVSPYPLPVLVPGSSVHFVLTFTNVGRSPAYGLIGTTTGMLGLPDLPDDFVFPPGDIVPGMEPHEVVLPPGKEYRSQADLLQPISEEDIDRLRRGELRHWLYGEHTYHDVFGEEHRVQFCYFFVPKFNGEWAPIHFRRHNDSN